MNTTTKYPFFITAPILLIGFYFLINMLYIGQSILIPVIYAIIIAILLRPAVNFLVRKKINRGLAIAIVVFLSFLLVAALGALLVSQLTRFTESLPLMLDKFNRLIQQASLYAYDRFNVNPERIDTWLAKTKAEFINNISSIIGSTLLTLGGMLEVMFLIPVYIIMILYYQPLLLEFVRKLFTKNNQHDVNEILIQTRTIIQKYLTGLLIEAAIIATLYTVCLFILGIDYALLLGVTGAMLNVIPFLGGVLSLVLPLIVAIVTKDSYTASVMVTLTFTIIQFFDNHYIIPKIVASKVRINALISLIVVFAGGVLWGIPGMFISIPIVAILKVIFDHIPNLKPWGYLLGDTLPNN